jgi:hypothetical protein
MEAERENGWRDQEEPRQTMQKKDNAPNNQLKRNQKMEDKKGKPSAKKIVSRKVLPKEQEAIESRPPPPYSQP